MQDMEPPSLPELVEEEVGEEEIEEPDFLPPDDDGQEVETLPIADYDEEYEAPDIEEFVPDEDVPADEDLPIDDEGAIG